MPIVFAGITISVSSSGALSILSGLLTLSGGWPVVNGQVYRNAAVKLVSDSNGAIVANYDLGPQVGSFVLNAAAVAPDHVTIQYTIQNVSSGRTFDSFGLHFDSAAGMKRYYKSGYHSWDGSYYVQPDGLLSFTGPQLDAERGYGVTQLIPTDGQAAALVLGFDRHDRYQQTFTFGARQSPPDLAIETWWDEIPVDPVAGAASETLWVLQDSSYEEGLRRWARAVAAASPLPPRLQNSPLIGWGTWYDLYNFITDPLIRDSLQAVSSVVQAQNLPMRTFLIDAGFTPELGDWLTTTPDFPNGMAPLLSAIQGAGFVPGLWIAPLLVGNRSQLYINHPDWVLQDAVNGGPKLWEAFYGEQRLGNMRSEEYYVLDTTNPDALDYLRNVFRTWRSQWGAQMFKIDFSYVGADWGPQQVQYQTPGMTRIQVWRQFAEMVRQEIGDDAIWVASGQPLWASIGLADTIRISGDVGVVWSGNAASADGLMRDLPTRNFANHILWQVDPDDVLLRTQFHYLTDAEVRSLALFAGMSGGVMMTSDNLAELPPDRIALWKMVLSTANQNCSYPFNGRNDITYVPYQTATGQTPIAFSDPLVAQVRADANGISTVSLLNNSTAPILRTLPLSSLGVAGPQYVWDPVAMSASSSPVSQVTVSLDTHETVLLYFSPTPFMTTPVDLAGN